MMINGFEIHKLHLPHEVNAAITSKDWYSLDKLFHIYTAPGGILFSFLQSFEEFNEIEFIISLREAQNDWEEDGIWHDDGSRKLAFSLSLTHHAPQGGVLEIRKKGEQDSTFIPTPEFGSIIVFQTGLKGFEHKINAVTNGHRLIIAGWCS
jgi:hypothetical protein